MGSEAVEFTCEACHETYPKLWSDANAAAEAAQAFTAEELVDAAVVCDPCWRAMLADMPDLLDRYSSVESSALRASAIRSLADALDMPAEVLNIDTGGTGHWSSFLPKVDQVDRALRHAREVLATDEIGRQRDRLLEGT